MTEADAGAPTCMQTVQQGGDCCTSYDGVCAEPATWEHVEGRVRLCDVHAGNARKFGGAKLGYWMVGETKVSYPDGWTSVADGSPLIDEAPAAEPRPAASSDPKVRPSGLILP